MKWLTALVLSLALCGCMVPIPPAPTPVPPAPVPPEPPSPPPSVTLVPRDAFEGVVVGGPVLQLEGLPSPYKETKVGSRTIYVWVLDEPREGGGYVNYEVHTEGGKVAYKGAW